MTSEQSRPNGAARRSAREGCIFVAPLSHSSVPFAEWPRSCSCSDMASKWGLRSGIVVAILAQCAVFAACDPEGPPAEGDGGAGGAAAGDGDGGTGGVEPAGTGGSNDCEDLLLITNAIRVGVVGGWQEAEQQCRATVAVSFDGETHELDCSGSEGDCYCYEPAEVSLPNEGVTLTVSEGETVLYEQIDLQQDQCGGYGYFEVDYAEALGQAVSSLKNAAPELTSTVPCETEADCAAVPLGAKACGGPHSYAIASKQSETYSDLVALSEELERIERIYNLVAEISSDCAHEVEPEVTCEGDLPTRFFCVATSPE